MIRSLNFATTLPPSQPFVERPERRGFAFTAVFAAGFDFAFDFVAVFLDRKSVV